MKFAAAMVVLLVAVAAATTFWLPHGWTGGWLAVVKGLAVAAGVLWVMLALRAKSVAATATAERPPAFGYKSAWLAVRGASRERLAAALGLQDVRQLGWRSGFAVLADRNGEVMVSEPIDGWTLAIGAPLANAGAIVPDCDCVSLPLAALAAEFPEVQLFVTDRVVELHTWALYRDGRPVRRFSWCGETGVVQWDEGEPTAAERELGLLFSAASADAVVVPDEAVVLRIAGAWSLDPRTLGERDLPKSTVLLGMLAR